MDKILVVSGDVAQGLYKVNEIALGLARVELQGFGNGSIGEGVIIKGYLLDGGTLNGITDREGYLMLKGEIDAH